jgi:hypothetical protein
MIRHIEAFASGGQLLKAGQMGFKIQGIGYGHISARENRVLPGSLFKRLAPGRRHKRVFLR